MFSEDNRARINNNEPPIADDVWMKFNPEQAALGYENQKLISHHAEGGELAAAIPESMHYDYFSELHPYVALNRFFRGQRVGRLANGTVNVLGSLSWFTGVFSGDPDAWINGFGFGDPHVGDIKKDWKSGVFGLYYEIKDVEDEYTPVVDNDGHPVIDQHTGKPKMRLATKTITADVYTGYIWDEEKKKFKGVNKVGTEKEVRTYDENGHLTEARKANAGPILD